MKAMVYLLAMVYILTGAAWALAGEYVISGYRDKEFALDEEKAAELKNAILGEKKDGAALRIWIQGSASKTGFYAENDDIAQKRAEQYRAFLSHEFHEFPDAKIESNTLGDKKDKKETFIRWNWEKTAVVKEKQIENSQNSIANWISISLLGLAMAVCFRAFLKKKRAKKSGKTLPNQREPQNGRCEWLIARNEVGEFRVRTQIVNGLFILPFKSLKNPDANIVWKERRDAKISARGCMNKLDYRPQIPNLVANGDIEKIE